ncbi:hypothetical protein N7466_007335 [Penicillium verhagenii]|uniref:uncharacterized protein n=1 Tax=Penicillium verhagenii TaxID=1562060 RepID=UPI00254505DA|nr:uncharacterized protein N7466_007335 [Penicillium verhagenii]KAJ5928379.1 hypothetical protein N7466_007335 [Penicillium verhagenii]
MGLFGASIFPRGEFTEYLMSDECLVPAHLTEVEQPFIGNMTFYHFNLIVSGVCTLITLVLILSLMVEHSTHCSVPSEQVKIMRIVHMLPAFSTTSFLSIAFPNSYVYLEGFTEFYQALALYAFHMLLIEFVAPSERKREEFFGNLKVKKIFRKNQYRDGVSWLKLSYYSTLQYPIVALFVAIAQCITAAFNRYCLGSNQPAFAHLWLELIQEVSVTIAINAVIRFYANTKNYMKEHKPLMKLLSFKMMVGLIFLEQVLFMVLESSKVFKQTPKLSYADVHTGIPTMVICVQMVPFAFFIRYAFNTKVYRVQHSPSDPEQKYAQINEQGRPVPRAYQGGPFGVYAWLAYFNPMEYIREVQSMYRTLHHVHVRHHKRIYKEEVEGNATSEDSESEQLVGVNQQQALSAQTSHEMSVHNESFEQVRLSQAQPLMPEVQYPAQPHYGNEGFEQPLYGQEGFEQPQYGQDVPAHEHPQYGQHVSSHEHPQYGQYGQADNGYSQEYRRSYN